LGAKPREDISCSREVSEAVAVRHTTWTSKWNNTAFRRTYAILKLCKKVNIRSNQHKELYQQKEQR
jgi:hypothetical protein